MINNQGFQDIDIPVQMEEKKPLSGSREKKFGWLWLVFVVIFLLIFLGVFFSRRTPEPGKVSTVSPTPTLVNEQEPTPKKTKQELMKEKVSRISQQLDKINLEAGIFKLPIVELELNLDQ